MREDWEKIETDYIAGKQSYREIAQKYGLAPSTVARQGKKRKWPEKRAQFARKVQTRKRQKTAEKKASREAAALMRVEALGEELITAMEQALEDKKQLYRHVIETGRGEQGEKVLGKMDTRALKDIAVTLAGIGKMLGEMGGLLTAKEKEQLKLAREKLALDKAREKREAARQDAGEKAQEVRITFAAAAAAEEEQAEGAEQGEGVEEGQAAERRAAAAAAAWEDMSG